MSMPLSKGIVTYFEVVVLFSISPERDAGINIRGSHYGTVVQALSPATVFLLHLQQSLLEHRDTPGWTRGRVGKLKGHRT